LTVEAYTVGWICALPNVFAASKAMLDEAHTELRRDETNSQYALGRIGQLNVVLACLPAGMDDTNNVDMVAPNLLRRFPGIRFSLMVGIGGGAPSDEHDIHLGDVVVSKPGSTHGGVVQYVPGKTIEEGGFIRTSSLNKLPPVLLTAITVLEVRHRTQKSKVSQHLSKILALYPTMAQQFQYQDSEHDLLFEANYNHLSSQATCDNCNNERLVSRPSRHTTDPVIHYGLIGLVNQIPRNGSSREKLRQEKNILCFETEAAGLVDNFPCLIIYGISNYSDSHRDKWWESYAAAVAAAYAKELLYIIFKIQADSTKETPELQGLGQFKSSIGKEKRGS
ncbi:purine and uridine phosphorylase, partial [Glonium stellatum]